MLLSYKAFYKYIVPIVVCECYYCSLTKERPLLKEHPPPSFGSISCIGSKFARMSTHPGASYVWPVECTRGVWEEHLQAHVRISMVRNFVLYFTECYYKAALHRRMYSLVQHAPQAKPYILTWCAVQPSVACDQALTSKPLVALLYVIVQLFASRALSRCKHDMGALS